MTTPITTSDAIVGRAMLVDLTLSQWTARKHDREVTRKVNDQYNATKTAGRYHKHLFGGPVPELTALHAAANRVYATHMTNTLAWADSGWRVLPTDNYFRYAEAMRAATADLAEAAEAFAAELPGLIEQAKLRLNGMFRAADYPTPEEVKARFKAVVDYAPLPVSDDLRIALPEAEKAEIAKAIEDRLTDATTKAMTAAWERLHTVVQHVRDRLDNGKFLRDAMFEDLRAVADVLARLNLTNDPDLETLRQAVVADLGKVNVEAVKDNELARTNAVKKADAILARMKGFYTPAGGAS